MEKILDNAIVGSVLLMVSGFLGLTTAILLDVIFGPRIPIIDFAFKVGVGTVLVGIWLMIISRIWLFLKYE